MKKLGVLGGTFNPLHNGHIALAEAAQKAYQLDEVLFIPSGNPPHKKEKTDIIDKEYRYEMVKLAIAGNKTWGVSRMEMDRPGFSYAVDTFKELKAKYKNAKLYYIMGLDSINEILEWRKPLELFKYCEIIVGTRPGARIRTFRRMVKFPPLAQEVDKIDIIELNENISASDIREKLKKGISVADVVPTQVVKYIERKKIYQ
ncbi:MAG: nicotinate-nucleotide adenylyltransferase [Candidatus Margulisbacteria bacterium]|nr:nicotinate-nucleotide adenylyltransferase [Candidatus Margulisiibacteriota bacterium]